MRAIFVALIAGIAAAPLTLSAPAEAASRCIGIRGHGLGVTQGIASWMANKAVNDSAKKWAEGRRYRLSHVRISCSGLTCTGEAKACR